MLNCLYCDSDQINFNNLYSAYKCDFCGEIIDRKSLEFPWDLFDEGKIMAKINAAAAEEFLEFCSNRGLRWGFDNSDAEKFNPISFYKNHQNYLIPLQKVENPDEVYIYCFYGKLFFNFSLDWTNQGYKIYDLSKD